MGLLYVRFAVVIEAVWVFAFICTSELLVTHISGTCG